MLPAIQIGITPTDVEFRYQNSKSVGANLDLASKAHGFERKLSFLLVKSRITSADVEFRYLNSKSVGVYPELASKTHGFERRLYFLPVKLR